MGSQEERNGPDAPPESRPETGADADRKPWLSAILSAAGPGLGQFYNGDTLTGLAFFLGYLIVSFGLVTAQYRPVLLTVIWFVAIVEALWSASCINRRKRPFAGTSHFLYGLIAFYVLIVILHILTGKPDAGYLAKMFPVLSLAVT